jgi:hypothetical protein
MKAKTFEVEPDEQKGVIAAKSDSGSTLFDPEKDENILINENPKRTRRKRGDRLTRSDSKSSFFIPTDSSIGDIQEEEERLTAERKRKAEQERERLKAINSRRKKKRAKSREKEKRNLRRRISSSKNFCQHRKWPNEKKFCAKRPRESNVKLSV